MIVIVMLISTIVLYYISSWLWQKWLRSTNPRIPPMFPGDLPVIGHAHLVLGNTIHLWNNVLKKLFDTATDNGGVVTFCLGSFKPYILTDPEDCQLVANICLEKESLIYDLAKPWMGQGLLIAPVSIWRPHRKLLSPAFSQPVLDGYMTVFNAQSKKLIHSLQEQVGKGFFDHVTFIKRTMLEIVCLTMMGIDEQDDIVKNDRFMDAVNDMFHIMTQRVQSVWMLSDALFKLSALGRKHDKLVEILHDMSNSVVRRRKAIKFDIKNSEKNNENTPKMVKSLLDILLETSGNGSLTDKEIREEVDSMITAGYDTSSTLVTIAFVLIGSYPEVQLKLYQELLAVFEGSNRDVSKHDLSKLVYMEAVLKETLRLYPVVPMIVRRLDRDVELKNYTLSAGRSCVISIYGINTHPVWGPDRLQFRPERWLNQGDLPDTNTAFAGFSFGKHLCLGQKFAMMVSKTVLSHVLRTYRVSGDYTKMVLIWEGMLKPAYGHHIHIERR